MSLRPAKPHQHPAGSTRTILKVAAAEDEDSARPDPHALPLINPSGEIQAVADLARRRSTPQSFIIKDICRPSHLRLGIGRRTLYRKLKELGLDDEAAWRFAR
jgi:DNA-binding NtrC family response regulator